MIEARAIINEPIVNGRRKPYNHPQVQVMKLESVVRGSGGSLSDGIKGKHT